MAQTRRLSGLNQPSSTTTATQLSTGLMLETYEIFKRKHLSQNKEIIHKNSELTKANSELQRRISLLRAENLSLKGSQFQLECENAGLRDKLERSEERERENSRERTRSGAGLDAAEAETMRQTLEATISALQAFGSLIVPSTTSSQASASPGPLTSSSLPTNNIAISRRRSVASSGARAPRPSMTSRPDLSYISEGEGSAEMEENSLAGWGTVLEGLREESSNQLPAHSEEPTTYEYDHPSPPSSPPPLPPTRSTPPARQASRTPAVRPVSKSRAPPPAASSSAASSSTDPADFRRPARRISGLLKPSLSSTVTRAGGEESGKGKERERVVLKETQRLEPERVERRRKVLSSSSEDEMSDDQASEAEQEVEVEVDEVEYEEEVVLRQREKEKVRRQSIKAVVVRAAKVKREEAKEEVQSEVNPRRRSRSVEPMESLGEDNEPTAVPIVEEQPGGRRARASVNYAQPKLNVKMRRPADYVPENKTTGGKPRRSVKPASSSTIRHSSISTPSSSTGMLEDAIRSDASDSEDKTSELSFPTKPHGRSHSTVSRDAGEREVGEVLPPTGRTRRHSLAM